MKVYTKPKMLTLSISANDALCSCNYTTRGTSDPFLLELAKQYGGSDNLLDPNDPVFGESSEGCSVIVDAYCKFGPNDQIIFTS